MRHTNGSSTVMASVVKSVVTPRCPNWGDQQHKQSTANLEDGRYVNLTPELVARYTPVAGDFWVYQESDGYSYFCPRDVFQMKYRPSGQLTFGDALYLLKNGNKVARRGWNGKGQFVVMMPSLYLPPYNTADTSRKVNDRTAKWIGEDAPLDCQPYFALYNAQKKWQPGWVPSQGDLFAEDWEVAE